jgi:hypothetical protein
MAPRQKVKMCLGRCRCPFRPLPVYLHGWSSYRRVRRWCDPRQQDQVNGRLTGRAYYSPTGWAVWVASAAVCVAAAVLVANLPASALPTPEVLTWAVAIGLGALAWPTLRHRSTVGLILVYGFLGFGIAAALLYQPPASDFNTPDVLVAQVARQTAGYHYLTVFLVAALAIWLISLLIGVIFPRKQAHSIASLSLHLSARILPLAALPLLANIYGTGIHTIFHSGHYLEHTGPIVAVRLGQALGPVGVLICGYFTFDRRQAITTRTCALLLALSYEVMFLGTATRFFAFWVPLMFAGGLLTGTWSSGRQRLGVIVVAAVAILALQIPLGLRNLPSHGLIPGISYLFHEPSLVFGGHNPINNFLFGAPLSLYVAHNVGSLPFSDATTSLSPMPSQFNNWAQIAPSLRVNSYTPYSALGELLNHGWPFFFLIMAFFGAGFALTERVALGRTGLAGGVSQIIVFGAAALFVVECTEYNLRSVTRLMYYAFVGVLVIAIILPWRKRRALSGTPRSTNRVIEEVPQ